MFRRRTHVTARPPSRSYMQQFSGVGSMPTCSCALLLSPQELRRRLPTGPPNDRAVLLRADYLDVDQLSGRGSSWDGAICIGNTNADASEWAIDVSTILSRDDPTGTHMCSIYAHRSAYASSWLLQSFLSPCLDRCPYVHSQAPRGFSVSTTLHEEKQLLNKASKKWCSD